MPKPAEEAHTGLLGPVLRAAVGDALTIVLRNNVDFPINLEPAGVQSGSSDASGGGAALSPAVQPGQTATYRFVVPPAMGPGLLEPTAKLWLYRCGAVWSGVEWSFEAAARGAILLVWAFLPAAFGLDAFSVCMPCIFSVLPQVHRRPAGRCQQRFVRGAARQVCGRVCVWGGRWVWA